MEYWCLSCACYGWVTNGDTSWEGCISWMLHQPDDSILVLVVLLFIVLQPR